eukprot:g5986.t1
MAQATTLRVVFPYESTQPDECSLAQDDIVEGYQEVEGWWRGKSQGKEGIFPANYVEVAPAGASPAAPPAPLPPLPPPADENPPMAATLPPLPPGDAPPGAGGEQMWGADQLRAMKDGAGPPTASNPMFRRSLAPGSQANLMPKPEPPPMNTETGGGGAAARQRYGTTASMGREKPNPLQFTYVAHNMGLGCSLMLYSLGLISIVWDNGPDRKIVRGSTLVGLYCVGLATLIYLFQYRFGLGQRFWETEMRLGIPVQGLIYIGASAFTFFSNATILCGVFLIVNGCMYCAAWKFREGVLSQKKEGGGRGGARKGRGKGAADPEPPIRSVRDLQERGLLPKAIWAVVYVVFNVALWAEAHDRWTGIVADANARPQSQKVNGDLSYWTPMAKAFGQLLNFNCSLILFPILRNLLLFVTEAFSNLNVSIFSVGSKETLYKYAPLSKTIAFHKVVAYVVFFSAYMHTLSHFLNFGYASRAVDASFGVGPWITGGVICLAMFFIYPAASNNVRRRAFRVFWSSHHWFLFFFLFCIFHGPVFVYWAIIPIGLFACERLLRFVNSERQVGFSVKALKWLKPVLAIYWCPRVKEKFHFKEGQYVYLCVPAVNEEYHPFTISSAYDDLVQRDFVSCHIKVNKGGWTDKVKDYFEAMNPHGDYPFRLTRRDEKGELQEGKFVGPEGTALLRVDGPHSAPGEHYDKYETVMLIGAGIGLTPVAAIMQAVTQYKWKRGFHPEILHVYWIVRQEELPAFQWFIGLLTALERDLQVDRAKQLGYTANVYLEVNIFVTRASPDFQTPQVVEQIDSDKAIAPGGATVRSFSAQQLMEMCIHPPTKSKMVMETMRQAMQGGDPSKIKNRLQDVWCWDGRPDWNQIFAYVKQQRRYRDIGVCFCGTPIVGKDLKAMCKKYSTLSPSGGENEVMFRLHKENF